MNIPEHCRMSEYLLEYCLYSLLGCEIYAGIEKELRSPHIYVGEYNLRDEVIRWADYHILGSSDSEYDLSPEATRYYIKHNNMTFYNLKKKLPNANKHDKEKKYIAKTIEIDKGFQF